MTGQATPTEARPKPLTLDRGAFLESPALQIAEALRQEQRTGAKPKWERLEGGLQKQVTGNQVWQRKLGDFVAVVTVGFKGDGTLRIDGPSGYSAKESEFDPKVVAQVLAALPDSVAPYVQSVPAAVPQRPVVKTVDVVVTTPARSGNWLSRIGIGSSKPEVKVTEAPVDRGAQVREAVMPLLDKLSAIEDKVPAGNEGLAVYLEASQALRRSLSQALTAMEIKPAFATDLYTKHVATARSLLDSLSKIDPQQLTRLAGVGQDLANDLRSLNDKVVGELQQSIDSGLLDALMNAAAATGNDAVHSGRVAMSAARTAIDANLPLMTVLELHGAKALTRATSNRLDAVEKSKTVDAIKQLFAGLDAVNKVDERLYPNYYQVFANDDVGAEKLVFTGTGFWWNDPNDGPRAIKDAELGNVTVEGVTASLDELSERVIDGLKRYFVDGGHIPGVTRVEDLKVSQNELVTSWKNQAEQYLAPLAKAVSDLRAKLDAPTTPDKATVENDLNAKKEELFTELDLLSASFKTANFNIGQLLAKDAF